MGVPLQPLSFHFHLLTEIILLRHWLIYCLVSCYTVHVGKVSQRLGCFTSFHGNKLLSFHSLKVINCFWFLTSLRTYKLKHIWWVLICCISYLYWNSKISIFCWRKSLLTWPLCPLDVALVVSVHVSVTWFDVSEWYCIFFLFQPFLRSPG